MSEDILVRAKAFRRALEMGLMHHAGDCYCDACDWDKWLPGLITEVERLRLREAESHIKTRAAIDRLESNHRNDIASKDAHIDTILADQKRYHRAWVASEKKGEGLAARIKELEAAMQTTIGENLDMRDSNNAIAALRDKQDAYIKRLETAFLKAERCPTCNGKGVIVDQYISRVRGLFIDESIDRVCPMCDGKGEENARAALEQIRAGRKG